jgi:glutaminyl-tRNA synthetase
MENFIHDMIEMGDNVVTRFPPEPNGYLHLGHYKSIHLNFETARKFNGKCNLRFDDTNPEAEDIKYVEAIKEDLKWLGYEPDEVRHASAYFKYFIEAATYLIKTGKAYVCELTSEEIKEYMGTTDSPGKHSPSRDNDIEENLALWSIMIKGNIIDGGMTLRAKIDMSSPNVHMRDPIIYRVKSMEHHTAGFNHVYPMYDFAHPLSDYLEGITHSLCTLEFDVHRPLYDWVIENCKDGLTKHLSKEITPRQTEFARLNLSHTIMSKRKLKTLVDEGVVEGWDDPRLPTIAGMRRRGIPAEALKKFCDEIGVTRRESVIDMSVLDKHTRDVLNKTSNRRMVVFDPIKVTITNWEGEEEWLSAKVNPESDEPSVRMVNFGRNLYIEREDFMEDAPKKFFRLAVGREVRFKYGYYVTCNEVIKDEDGNIVELLCTYDPETKGGWIEGRKVKGTIHWVNADNYKPITVNLYDRLFSAAEPTDNFLNEINKISKLTVEVMMEAAGPHALDKYLQFERNGYYVHDADGTWNRTLPLRDGYKK